MMMSCGYLVPLTLSIMTSLPVCKRVFSVFVVHQFGVGSPVPRSMQTSWLIHFALKWYAAQSWAECRASARVGLWCGRALRVLAREWRVGRERMWCWTPLPWQKQTREKQRAVTPQSTSDGRRLFHLKRKTLQRDSLTLRMSGRWMGDWAEGQSHRTLKEVEREKEIRG